MCGESFHVDMRPASQVESQIYLQRVARSSRLSRLTPPVPKLSKKTSHILSAPKVREKS